MTDEQRREVAERLRECRGGWSSGECYYTIINALGWPDRSREMGGHALYAALADLIEPPAKLYDSPDSSNSEADEGHEVAIDREALLALADELEEDACWEVQSPGVDNCAWRLKDVCDRIREALGVER